jgi:hypothetical protein
MMARRWLRVLTMPMGFLFRPREWAVQEETLYGKAVQPERTPVLHMLTSLSILFHSRDRNVFRGVPYGIYPGRERFQDRNHGVPQAATSSIHR